jgi:hypothetical protein
MMPWYSVGPSSYPDLKGQTQYVNSPRIAAQFLSMARDYAVKFGKNGDRLSANEGKRSKKRCEELYEYFIKHGYPVAAALYLSRHYELTHGNAIDVGVTMKDGTNRALTAEEFAWMHEQCELRGFTWTGVNFGEPWHIEGATRPEVFPPYPGINVDNAVLPEPAKPDNTPVGDIVNTIIVHVDNGKGGYDSFLANADTMQCMHIGSITQETFWKNVGVKVISGRQARTVLSGFAQVEGKGSAL